MSARLSFAADAYPDGTRHAPHQHDSLQLSVVLSGHLTETVGHVTEHASALSVVCKAPGVRHANRFGDGGARLARLTLPDGTMSSLVDDTIRAPEWRWTHTPSIAAPFLRIIVRVGAATDDIRPIDEAGAAGPCSALAIEPYSVAFDDPDLLDLLAAFTAQPAPTARGAPPAWLEEVTTRLLNEWHPQLRVGGVARRAGVHPVYLARCLRRWYGVSVGSLLRGLRLRAALARCADSHDTFANIAHAVGYADEAHLSRALREGIGMAPGRYRALLKTVPFRLRPLR